MPTTYSRINKKIALRSDRWLVSKVDSHGHTILVFEGEEPSKPGTGWLWACDFVPAKYRYNDHTAGPIHTYAVNAENIVGTSGLVRTSHPYGDRADERHGKYFTLTEKHFTTEHKSKSWYVPISTARKVQIEINEEEKSGAPMYQTLGHKSVVSKGLRAWCTLFGESEHSGFNCESWVTDKLEKCGIKDAHGPLEFLVSLPGHGY